MARSFAAMTFLSRMPSLKRPGGHARTRPGRKAARSRLSVEALEDRSVPSGVSALPKEMVYVLSNDTRPGQNAVLAFSEKPDGSLKLEGTFRTGGTGLGNPD